MNQVQARNNNGAIQLFLKPYANGLTNPVDISSTGVAGDLRLFVVEQNGRIRVIDPSGTLLPAPFLDIRNRVASGGERGLLGLAFNPNFVSNGYFYVNYTRNGDGATVISRFEAFNPGGNVANGNSELVLLTVSQPYGNHNGGDLEFGLDGYLYIPLGDGGSGGDPQNRAQDFGELLGKILRIDVDASGGLSPDCGGNNANYYIPADNPFVDGPGNDCDEIWSYGLRNPWRFSFDKQTGDMFIGDVGQYQWEEIDFQPVNSTGGENYGWRCYEGTHAYNLSLCNNNSSYDFPVFEYPHGNPGFHCSVTGGYIYRGNQFSVMTGHYLLADFCSGTIWSLYPAGNGNWLETDHGSLISRPTTFGEDVNGELYIASHNEGVIYHIQEINSTPWLAINKDGPLTAASGDPITYTLTITNTSPITATNVTISDTIPQYATYVSSGLGGILAGGVVTWGIPTLSHGGVVSVELVVTATQTIRNQQYAVSADGWVVTTGQKPIITIIDPSFIYLPSAYNK